MGTGWGSAGAGRMMYVQTLRCWGGESPGFSGPSRPRWGHADARLHCRHSQSHEVGRNTDLCLWIGSCKDIVNRLFIPPAFSLNVPLPWPCRLVIQGSPPPSPGNTFYFSIPIIQGYDSCFPRRLTHAQAQGIWVVSPASLPLQCSVSTEIFWRRNYQNYDSNGEILGGGSIHMQGGIWLNSQHLFIPQDLPQACPLLFWALDCGSRALGTHMWGSHRKHLCVARGGRAGQWEMTSASITRNSNLHVSASSFKRRGVTNVIMAIWDLVDNFTWDIFIISSVG